MNFYLQGGQILRNAMALSCLLQQPIHITKIRAGRINPGLRPQHLTGIQLLSELCGGKLEGGYAGSSEVTFCPKPIVGGNFTADTKTAGYTAWHDILSRVDKVEYATTYIQKVLLLRCARVSSQTCI